MTAEEKERKELADLKRQQMIDAGLISIHDDKEETEGKKSTKIMRKRKNKKDEPKVIPTIVESAEQELHKNQSDSESGDEE